jgi:hypothetical protein
LTLANIMLLIARMLPQQRRKSTKKRIRFAGIGKAAAALEVTRVHLYRVLVGERRSPELKRRYRQWKATRKGAAK